MISFAIVFIVKTDNIKPPKENMKWQNGGDLGLDIVNVINERGKEMISITSQSGKEPIPES